MYIFIWVRRHIKRIEKKKIILRVVTTLYFVLTTTLCPTIGKFAFQPDNRCRHLPCSCPMFDEQTEIELLNNVSWRNETENLATALEGFEVVCPEISIDCQPSDINEQAAALFSVNGLFQKFINTILWQYYPHMICMKILLLNWRLCWDKMVYLRYLT